MAKTKQLHPPLNPFVFVPQFPANQILYFTPFLIAITTLTDEFNCNLSTQKPSEEQHQIHHKRTSPIPPNPCRIPRRMRWATNARLDALYPHTLHLCAYINRAIQNARHAWQNYCYICGNTRAWRGKEGAFLQWPMCTRSRLAY